VHDKVVLLCARTLLFATPPSAAKLKSNYNFTGGRPIESGFRRLQVNAGISAKREINSVDHTGKSRDVRGKSD
jgi:hypothetical protein